jgi:predicted enzyme related to lactoylglutathione lyase
MKLISISSLLYYVTDIDKTKQFYEDVGFIVENKSGKVITYLNWFSIEFRPAAKPVNSDCGELVYIKVDSVEEMQKRLLDKGINPDGEPQDVGGGVKELHVKDPDGYKLVFFQKK